MATPIPENEAAFRAHELVAATGGTWSGPSAEMSSVGVVIDSRRVKPGSLFVAIVGASQDGHRFVDAAVHAGASVVLVDREVRVPASVGVLQVADTTRALGDLAHHHRMRWVGKVLGITGSAGKTTTKELCAEMLMSTGHGVLATRGNLNNLWGVPMTLFGLSAEHRYAVVEMGTNQPGEIARLAEIVRPDVAMVTLVSAAHTEGLGGVEGVLREKASIFVGLPEGGTAIVYADDSQLVAQARSLTAARLLTFGVSEQSSIRILEATLLPTLETGVKLQVSGCAELLQARLQIPGEAASRNAAAAVTAGVALGVDLQAALPALEAVAPSAGRMWLRELAGRVVLDDSYNANPSSTAGALRTLSDAANLRRARSVAFLGDMKELGDLSLREHQGVLRLCRDLGVDMLVACGPEMGEAIEEDPWEGAPPARFHHVHDAEQALEHIGNWTAPGDVILVKGSRSMRMEQLCQALVEMEGRVS